MLISDAEGRPLGADAVSFAPLDTDAFEPCSMASLDASEWRCQWSTERSFVVKAQIDGDEYETNAEVSENECGLITETVEIEVEP